MAKDHTHFLIPEINIETTIYLNADSGLRRLTKFCLCKVLQSVFEANFRDHGHSGDETFNDANHSTLGYYKRMINGNYRVAKSTTKSINVFLIANCRAICAI